MKPNQSQLWVLILRKGPKTMPFTVCATTFGDAIRQALAEHPDWKVVHA